MSARVPLVILPRELGQVPPPLPLIGHKARGLAQLLALKARVPRFGILTAEAFDAHLAQDDVQRAVDAARTASQAAQKGAAWDEAARLAHGEAMVRAVLRNTLPVAVRIALQELLSAFADEDVLAVRASVVGEPVEASVLTGALDSALGVRGKDALEDAVLRILALAVHPRTLGLREAGGLPAIGCRLAVVVQRMVQSESSGVCVSLETALPGASGSGRAGTPKALVRGTWGLAGGIGGKHGNPRIPSDVVRVERPAVAADGIDDHAHVESDIAVKDGQLKLDDSGNGTRMQPVLEHLKREACVSAVQSRMVAREALRLEAAFGKPQVMSWAFAGRLLHVLDVEPLLVPVTRVESERARTWDDRLLPAGLIGSTSPLTFSVWQRAGARGVERAGRILGVKGVILEDTRPQMPRLVGHVSGRVYGNVEVLTALLDLLPFADKARAALAAATGQGELVPRKAPPPGFWQRQRQKLDEGRWPGQLEKLSETAAADAQRFREEVDATLEKSRALRIDALDPDALIDLFDELEDALSKNIAGLVLSGLAATLFQRELDAVLDETELKGHQGLVHDLLAGEPPPELMERALRIYGLTDFVRRRPALKDAVAAVEHLDQLAARLTGDGSDLSDDERLLATELRALLASPAARCAGDLTLEGPRGHERPDIILETVARLLDTRADQETLEAIGLAASGARKKAEYTLEQMAPRLKSSAKKRFLAALEGVRAHGRAFATAWIPCEAIVERLRATAMALGERLFEHSLLDQPRDVLHLTTPEMAGLVRGTGVDADGKPLVAARKRQAAARPSGLPRRLETRGVVATSILSDDEDPQSTAPGREKELAGNGVSGGVVTDGSVLLDGNPLKPASPAVPKGVVVVRALSLRDLPLLLIAKGVVAERGSVWGPATWALRSLALPTIVDAPQATASFRDGETLTMDGALGLVRPVEQKPDVSPPASAQVDPHIFAREAVLSDPRGRVRAKSPAPSFEDLPVPPLVRLPASPGGLAELDSGGFALVSTEMDPVSDDFVVIKAKPPHAKQDAGAENDVDENDILERTDVDKEP